MGHLGKTDEGLRNLLRVAREFDRRAEAPVLHHSTYGKTPFWRPVLKARPVRSKCARALFGHCPGAGAVGSVDILINRAEPVAGNAVVISKERHPIS